MERIRTQVAIVGAGPAGLVLSQLLAREGVDCVVLEARSREYVEKRVRAGVLEQNTVDLLDELGVGERMHREGLVHEGIELRFGGRGHRIDMAALTGGRAITVYGQQEVVKDLIAAGGDVRFEVADVSVDVDQPRVMFTHEGTEYELDCEAIAGCDGFHGVCRGYVPAGVLDVHERVYPFAWLGILAHVAPPSHELIYTHHDRGFALASMRSLEVTRLYLQVPPDTDVDDWSDDRIWEEAAARMALDGQEFALEAGEVFEKGVTPMRSYVCEPMQHGRLYLAGDAVHIVPPTGAKGLNLAVADVRVLAEALVAWLADGREDLLNAYSDTCLRRVWRTQYFSYWMTSMLHRMPDDTDGFQAQLQRAQLAYVCSSEAAARSLAENYVGFDSV
jgi:p-hydroxybenzoate 3-monooxygenase